MRNKRVGPLKASLAMAFGLAFCAGSSFAEEKEADGFATLMALEVGHLDELRGGDGDTRVTVQSTQQMGATVHGSSFDAGTINSGGVTIGEHAMDNFSGVGVFNIVTGNNNAINAGVSVNFNLQ